jgi:hypothetical protein
MLQTNSSIRYNRPFFGCSKKADSVSRYPNTNHHHHRRNNNNNNNNNSNSVLIIEVLTEPHQLQNSAAICPYKHTHKNKHIRNNAIQIRVKIKKIHYFKEYNFPADKAV